MTDEWITEAAAQLGITLDPAWTPMVRANLELMLRLSGTMLDRPLPDDAEPAPVFRA